ncbi:MAG: metallophosphoesterase, partial [Armatimonadetes bacterium]|nr:metallophosphoesterase [Armatimonadota bacterium]
MSAAPPARNTPKRTKKSRPQNPSRRRFLKRGLIASGAALGGGVLWSAFGERAWTVAHQVSVPIANLPPALDGFTIAHLSDLHRGPFVSADHIREAAAIAVSHSPDLIVLTGDHVSYRAEYARSCAEALSSLDAPHGIYAVLGNHEYWTGS